MVNDLCKMNTYKDFDFAVTTLVVALCPCCSLMETNPSVWIRLVADDYAATLPAQVVLHATTQGSYLSTLVKFELEKGLTEPSIRLNCSAEEAKELVAAIRRGSNYEPPSHDSRLLSSLKQTFDYLGIPSANFPSTSATQEVLLVPSYCVGCQYPHMGGDASTISCGVLMYSSSAQGWANRARQQDTRPGSMRANIQSGHMGSSWLAAVLRSESTGAGEDLVYMLPNDVIVKYTPVLLHSNLEAGKFTAPTLHHKTRAAAMAAAGGKLYLVGGLTGWSDPNDTSGWGPDRPGSLEVYDPNLDTWFAATPPVPRCTLTGHKLVSNKQEGMLLALGGITMSESDRVHVSNSSWAQIGMYDINAGKWTLNPSGCSWPIPVDQVDIPISAAAAADDYTIMILRSGDASDLEAADGDESQPAAATSATGPGFCNVDLLDLRMWRFRSGRALQGHHSDGISLVAYDGKIIAIGGCVEAHPLYEYDGDPSTKAVSAYDVRTDSWSKMPDLPFAINNASAVVMRVPNVLTRS